MISFLLAAAVMIAGYIIYSRLVVKNFGPDDRTTPAISLNDGVDYVPMKTWKVFLVQLLNIAGTGPIFGALSGALFGPVVYLWIAFGSVFAGGVHDYLCGMLSERNNGASISEITGKYLGNAMKQTMRVFSVILLVMCGVVFTTGPADLLAMLTPANLNRTFWFWIIVVYYFAATFLPIDKIIGKIYPLFGICLILMAFGVSGSLIFSGRFNMPELWSHFQNYHPENIPVWPFMFVTVACGAVSGFHATQSPMMARCLKTERDGRKVFYGAMLAEGLIALVWAAAGVSCYDSSRALLEAGGGCSAVVYEICQTTLGKIGSILALIGVVICPISSGDTAYRSARLTLADWLKLDQSKMRKRLYLTLPLLIAGVLICQVDYQIIWRFFSWSNQTLAMIALWAASVYLRRNGKHYYFALMPAVFMSAVSMTYFCVSPECLGTLWENFGLPYAVYYPLSAGIGIICAAVLLGIFWHKRSGKEGKDL